MTPSRQNATRPTNSIWHQLLALVTGLFLALCLLKFGNPVIFEELISTPQNFLEFIYSSWPIHWGYVAVGILLLASFPVARWKKRTAPSWLLLSLLFWLIWQFAAATQTVDAKLTSATLRHFTICVICFFIGYFALSEVTNKTLVWGGLLVGYLVMLRFGFEQHFGGLAETRRYFELYVAPKLLASPPPEYLKKISSTRIVLSRKKWEIGTINGGERVLSRFARAGF